MSLSLYIILSVCLLIGVIFIMLARTTKEEPVSLEPPKVRGGTLFIPTVPHHVKIAPPEIMKSRLVAEELFVDYSIPGFPKGGKGPSKGQSGEGSGDTPETPPPLEPSAPASAKAQELAAEAEAGKLETVAAGLVNDPRNAEKLNAEEIAASLSRLRYEDSLGNTYMRDSEETSVFDLFFVQDVVVTPSVSANPDLDPANLGPDENLMIKRNGAILKLLNTEMFSIYGELMEQVDVILDADPTRKALAEFTRLMNQRELSQEDRHTLLTLFYKEQPEVSEGFFRAESFFFNQAEEVDERL